MKSLILAMTLIASTAAMAKPTATTAFQNVLPSGTYTGKNDVSACTVTVNITETAVGVTVKGKNVNDTFVVANSALSTSITATEVRATQSLSFPHYINGGTKILNVKLDTANNEAAVAISNILLDHRGNDASTYAECVVAL